MHSNERYRLCVLTIYCVWMNAHAVSFVSFSVITPTAINSTRTHGDDLCVYDELSEDELLSLMTDDNTIVRLNCSTIGC